jgi:hypothetical protein
MAAKSYLPKYVVRFYGRVEFAMDTIAHRQVTFVHASKLNDPFDPYFYFETNFDGSYANLLQYVRKKHPNDEQWFVKQVPGEIWDQSVKEIRARFTKLKNETYILSTSAPQDGIHPKDNLYMWGHYGNGHRGVAIEFATEEITRSLIDEHNQQTANILSDDKVWIKTQYAARLAPLTCADFFEFFKNEKERSVRKTSLENYFDLMTRTKSSVWKSENEWRLLWHRDDTRLTIHRSPISERAISAVYVGESASRTTEEDIAFEVKRTFPNAKIFKARKQIGAFALDFKPLV